MTSTAECAAARIEFRPALENPLGSACDCADRVRIARAFGSGRQFERELFSILQCRKCGLGVTDPVPTEQTAPLLYGSRESNDFQPDDSSLTSRLKAYAAQRDARAFLKAAPEPHTILDYGCGNGAFVDALAKVASGAEVYGADAHESPPSGVKHYRSYRELQERRTEFDFILCRHVLEHTYDPVDFLASLKAMLAPAGTLAIEVPSLDTIWRRVFRAHWDGFYVPYHPLHFTRDSLRRCVEAAGLKVTQEGTAEMPKVGRSLQNVFRCEYNLALFAAGMLLQPAQVLLSLLSRTSVCLRIWAQRDSEAARASGRRA